MNHKTNDHPGDQLAQDGECADDRDNRPVYPAGKVDGDPEKHKKYHHEHIPERTGVLLERIRIRCGKGCTQCDHHQSLRNFQIQGDRRRRENSSKCKENGDLVIALKDGNQELLSVKGYGIDESKGKGNLDNEEKEVLVACRENGKDDDQEKILKNSHPDDSLGIKANKFQVID